MEVNRGGGEKAARRQILGLDFIGYIFKLLHFLSAETKCQVPGTWAVGGDVELIWN